VPEDGENVSREGAHRRPAKGHFRGGLPYVRVGRGARPLVVIAGLIPKSEPPPGGASFMYGFLARDFTVFVVMRRAGLRRGSTIADIATDYASMMREEFDGPVDVIGTSTGGAIALRLAADHPDTVRRLVVHSSAHELSEPAKRGQLQLARLAEKRRWRDVWSQLLSFVLPQRGPAWVLTRPVVWTLAPVMALDAPRDPSDFVVIVEAEDRFRFRDRLGDVRAPTLVVAGDQDPFYTPDLFRETAAGIPDSRLVLYPRMGHPARGRRFRRDVLAFLREGGMSRGPPPRLMRGGPKLGDHHGGHPDGSDP